MGQTGKKSVGMTRDRKRSSVCRPTSALFILLINVAIHEMYVHNAAVSMIYSAAVDDIDIDNSVMRHKEKNKKNNIIYGHVHIPETGAEALNGLMAARFDNVCGEKGYSHDAYRANIRAFEKSKVRTVSNFEDDALNHRGIAESAWKYDMDFIGYENCDYISHNTPPNFWAETIGALRTAIVPSGGSISEQAEKHRATDNEQHSYNYNYNDNDNGLHLELHIPCRDPLEHLMAMARRKAKKYGKKKNPFACKKIDTDDTVLKKRIELVYSDNGLFDKDWIEEDGTPKQGSGSNNNNNNNNNHRKLRCFQPFPVETYIKHMENHLQTRRIPSELFRYKDDDVEHTNRLEECVWGLPNRVKKKIREKMVEMYPYMRFCDACMGTDLEVVGTTATAATKKKKQNERTSLRISKS